MSTETESATPVATAETEAGPAGEPTGVDAAATETETTAPPATETDTETTDRTASDGTGHGDPPADLEREGEIAADFLETLLDIADLDGDLEVAVEGDRAAVAIVDSEDGPAPRRLVGPHATVLEALQELTRLAVQAETGDRSRLMLDVASYRADRKAALITQARRIVSDVRESGESQALEPMSAFERKVVHDEVLAAGLSSESEGEEPNRYVVVLPAS